MNVKRRERAIGTGAILDDHRLTQCRTELVRDDAAERIAGATGAEWINYRDRACGIVFGVKRGAETDSRGGGQNEKQLSHCRSSCRRRRRAVLKAAFKCRGRTPSFENSRLSQIGLGIIAAGSSAGWDREHSLWQSDHPTPELLRVAKLDIVFTCKGERAVRGDAKHRHAGGHRRSVAAQHRHDARSDKEPAAGVDAEGA